MANTNKQFSEASFAKYMNETFNDTNNESNAAVKTFVEKTISKLGYPNKDEVHDVVNNYNDYDLSPIAERVPATVSGFLHDTERAFNLPAPDANTSPASIRVRHVEDKTKTGIIQMGDRKGEQYTSTTLAHDEFFIKNFTKAFKG